MRRRIVLAANSSWNIVNFRSGLIRALKDADYDPIVVAPTDSASDERLKALSGSRHWPSSTSRSESIVRA